MRFKYKEIMFITSQVVASLPCDPGLSYLCSRGYMKELERKIMEETFIWGNQENNYWEQKEWIRFPIDQKCMQNYEWLQIDM